MKNKKIIEMFKSLAEQTEDSANSPYFQFLKLLRKAIDEEIGLRKEMILPNIFNMLNFDNIECNGSYSKEELDLIVKYAARAIVNAYVAFIDEFGKEIADKFIAYTKWKC